MFLVLDILFLYIVHADDRVLIYILYNLLASDDETLFGIVGIIDYHFVI